MIEIDMIDLNNILENPISKDFDENKTYYWKPEKRGWKNKIVVLSTMKPDRDYLIKSGNWYIFSEKV